MRTLQESPDLRWFDALGHCRCGKPATGILRGHRNQSFGPHCARCAEARLKKSEKVRKKLEAERAAPDGDVR